MKVESEREQLRQHEQHLVARSAAVGCTAWVARSECCQRAKMKASIVKVERAKSKDESEQLRQYEQWKVARSTAAN